MTQTVATEPLPPAPQVIALGAHICDVHVWPVDEIAPGQSSALVREIKVSAAGAAGGTAVDLAKLGVPVASVGCVGNDALGQLLAGLLENHGVDCSRILRRGGAPTSATVLPIRSNGERPALHVRGTNELLTMADVDEATVLTARALHIGGPDEMTGLDANALAGLLGRAREAGVIITLDLLGGAAHEYREQLRAILPYINFFLPNHDQLRHLTRARTMAEAVADLRKLGLRDSAIITLGEAGAVVIPPAGDWTHIPAHDINVVDTTGCGDAFTAGFITGMLELQSAVSAAQLGTRAAALVATGLGSDAGLVDRAALDNAELHPVQASQTTPSAIDARLRWGTDDE